MKKINIFISLLIVSLFASCYDEVVDLYPVDAIDESTTYDTKDKCDLAVVGVYDAAQSGYYPGNLARRGYPFGAGSIIQSEMRGEDMINNEAFFQYTYVGTYSIVTANNQAMWENSYACINRANVTKEGLESAQQAGVLTADEAKALIAECLFIRALTYHNMLIHFARPYAHTSDASHPGLPLRLTGINTAEKIEAARTVGRSSVAVCYQQILDDLNYAELYLPEKNDASPISRTSQGAAIALKTRIYLHMGKMDKVLEEGDKLVPDAAPYVSPIGGYKLEGSPDVPFASYNKNDESIFSIENSDTDNCTVNGSLSQMMSTRDGARSLISVSPILFNAAFWKADDKRRTLLLMNSRKTKQDSCWYLDKYRNATAMSDWAPIIRYAEVLLNYAEAEARENGNTTVALNLLNAVRQRSTTDIYVSFATVTDLIQAILNERRIEFMGEGRRWEDIHRLALDPDFTTGGIPAKVSYAQIKGKDGLYDAGSGSVAPSIITVSARPYSSYRFLWPIPLSETSMNPTLAAEQNPDW